MAVVNIAYAGIVGVGIGTVVADSPVYGFGISIATASTVYIANSIFGSVGYYTSSALFTVIALHKVCNIVLSHAQREAEDPEKTAERFNRLVAAHLVRFY